MVAAPPFEYFWDRSAGLLMVAVAAHVTIPDEVVALRVEAALDGSDEPVTLAVVPLIGQSGYRNIRFAAGLPAKFETASVAVQPVLNPFVAQPMRSPNLRDRVDLVPSVTNAQAAQRRYWFIADDGRGPELRHRDVTDAWSEGRISQDYVSERIGASVLPARPLAGAVGLGPVRVEARVDDHQRVFLLVGRETANGALAETRVSVLTLAAGRDVCALLDTGAAYARPEGDNSTAAVLPAGRRLDTPNSVDTHEHEFELPVPEDAGGIPGRSLSFLDRVVVRVEPPNPIRYVDPQGKACPEQAEGLLVLVWLERGELAVDTRRLRAVLSAEGQNASGDREDRWTEHAPAHGALVPADPPEGVLAPSVFVFAGTVLAFNSRGIQAIARHAPRKIQGFARHAAIFRLLLDESFSEAAAAIRPPRAGLGSPASGESMLAALGARAFRSGLADAPGAGNASADAWLRVFDARTWDLIELVLQGAAQPAFDLGLVPDDEEDIGSFSEGVAARYHNNLNAGPSCRQLRQSLVGWQVIDEANFPEFVTPDRIDAHERTLRTRFDELENFLTGAAGSVGLKPDRGAGARHERPEAPESTRFSQMTDRARMDFLATLSQQTVAASIFLRSLPQGSGFLGHVARHLASVVAEDCRTIDQIVREAAIPYPITPPAQQAGEAQELVGGMAHPAGPSFVHDRPPARRVHPGGLSVDASRWLFEIESVHPVVNRWRAALQLHFGGG